MDMSPESLIQPSSGWYWHSYNEANTYALGETEYHLEPVPLTDSGAIRLATIADALAQPLGGVAGWGTALQYLDNELRCRFRVEEAGDYRICGNLTIDQRLKSWGFSTTGLNHGSHDISIRLGLYENNYPITGPKGRPVIWSHSADATFTEDLLHADLEAFIALIKVIAQLPHWAGPAISGI